MSLNGCTYQSEFPMFYHPWTEKQGTGTFIVDVFSIVITVHGRMKRQYFHYNELHTGRLGKYVEIRPSFFILFSSCPVVREQQYEVIIVPTFFVAVFIIILAIILWLFIRGQRVQCQSPGPQGKVQEGLSGGAGKMVIEKNKVQLKRFVFPVCYRKAISSFLGLHASVLIC